MALQIFLICFITLGNIIIWNEYWLHKYKMLLLKLEDMLTEHEYALRIASDALRNADRSESDEEFNYWIQKSNQNTGACERMKPEFELVTDNLAACRERIFLPFRSLFDKALKTA